MTEGYQLCSMPMIVTVLKSSFSLLIPAIIHLLKETPRS